MRWFVVICVVLTFGAGLVPAQGPEKHLDPPGPPRYDEFVYLYELTLLEDQDDPWIAFDGGTELMISTKITKPGHETWLWVRMIDGIDMDGDLSDEFTVLDGDELRAERKGKKANIYTHCECDPVVPMNLDIAVWEVDSIGAADVLEKIGKAAGLATEAGLLSGYAWIGKAAGELDEVGKAIDELGNDETSLGTESGIVPDGLSSPSSPTTIYRYRTQYIKKVSDDEKCSGTTRETGWERAGDLTLDEVTRNFYKYVGMGWDEDHPFTMCPSEAERRLALLQEALDLADLITFETEDHPGMEHHPAVYKGLAVALACNALETEVNGALSGEVIPPFVYAANTALDTGRALARTGDYAGALTTCSEHIPDLLVLNHPLVFGDSFENSDTRLWSHTEVPIIVVD